GRRHGTGRFRRDARGRAMTRRRVSLELPGWVAFVFATWLLLRAHLFFFRPAVVLHGFDEGYINAFAVRMNDGHMLPFVDAVSHRGPVLYWIAALAVRWGRATPWLPLRVAALVVELSAIGFTFAAAWRERRTFTGGIATLAIVCVCLLAYGP